MQYASVKMERYILQTFKSEHDRQAGETVLSEARNLKEAIAEKVSLVEKYCHNQRQARLSLLWRVDCTVEMLDSMAADVKEMACRTLIRPIDRQEALTDPEMAAKLEKWEIWLQKTYFPTYFELRKDAQTMASRFAKLKKCVFNEPRRLLTFRKRYRS